MVGSRRTTEERTDHATPQRPSGTVRRYTIRLLEDHQAEGKALAQADKQIGPPAGAEATHQCTHGLSMHTVQ